MAGNDEENNTYCVAFNLASTLLTMKAIVHQLKKTSQHLSFSFVSQSFTSFWHAFPTIVKATRIPFSHSLKTIIVYKGYCIEVGIVKTTVEYMV